MSCLGSLVLLLSLVELALAEDISSLPLARAESTALQQPGSAPFPPVPRTEPPRTLPSRSRTTLGPAQPPAAPATAPASAFALNGATRSLGGAGSQQSVASYMVGDFFSSSGQFFKPFYDPNEGRPPGTPLGEIPAAGGSRRVKISENNSPIPRDRIFYTFNGFDNAIPNYEDNTLIDVQRHTPGFEKTFLDGLGSIEVRTPVAYTQNSDVFLGGPGPRKAVEFGNISVAVKALLWSNDEVYWAAGLGVNLPTADDTRIFNLGDPVATIETQSVHLLPYVGGLWLPTDRLYVQGFLQVDVDTNGDPIETGIGPGAILNDQTLLYVDLSLGYWLMRDDDARLLSGIIPLLEFHYTTSLQDADIATVDTAQGTYSFGNVFNRTNVANITVGSHFRIGRLSLFTVAGCFPLSAEDDQRQFDSEIVAQFNRFF